jgi:hypothetical protein
MHTVPPISIVSENVLAGIQQRTCHCFIILYIRFTSLSFTMLSTHPFSSWHYVVSITYSGLYLFGILVIFFCGKLKTDGFFSRVALANRVHSLAEIYVKVFVLPEYIET